MADTIVFFVKYTTLAGVANPGQTYYSDPYDITAFRTVVLEAYNAGVTESATISVQPQQSSDLITWSDKGGALTPTSGNVSTVAITDAARYLRLKVTITGADGTVTFWAKAVGREN